MFNLVLKVFSARLDKRIEITTYCTRRRLMTAALSLTFDLFFKLRLVCVYVRVSVLVRMRTQPCVWQKLEVVIRVNQCPVYVLYLFIISKVYVLGKVEARISHFCVQFI